MTGLRWRPLIGALGVQAEGAAGVPVDVRELDAAALRSALGEHQLLVLRGQTLAPDELVQTARGLGPLDSYPFASSLPGEPHVVPIVKEAGDVHNFGGAWHTDTSYLPEPPSVTLLYALEVPAVGGDTLFADMYAAYASLSEGFRAALGNLRACNTSSLVHDSDGAYASVSGDAGSPVSDRQTSAVHPVVRRHPESSRLALYVSLIHTERFAGFTRQESLPLLEQLQAHAIRAENTTRLRWARGTLAIWDNRCVQHYPLNDYPGERREMHRVIIAGETPQAPTSCARS